MKRKHYKSTKGAVLLMALSLVLTAVPVSPVYAEDAETADGDASYSSVFIITDFPSFAKDGDGNYLDSTMQEQYGSLTVPTGTSFYDLGLPTSLSVTGYVEAEGADMSSEVELSDMIWKLKSDTDETYSENSPAGSYTFVPDLKEYMNVQLSQGTAMFDELKLADDIHAPKIKVTVADPEPEILETETEPLPAETEPQYIETEPLPAETEPQYVETEPLPAETEPQYIETEPLPAETELQYVETELLPAETEPQYIETEPLSAETEPQYTETEPLLAETEPQYTETDPASESSEENIFDGMDDSLIGAEGSVEFNDQAESSNEYVLPGDENVTENTELSSETDVPADVNEPADTGDTNPQTDANVTLTDLNVKIVITDVNGQTYTYPSDTTVVPLKANPVENENTASIVLPCDSPVDLTNLSLAFIDQATENPVTLTAILPEGATSWNFSGGRAQTFQITSSAGTENEAYTFGLVITKVFHTPGADATCTTPQTCTVCGTVLQAALGHTPGPAATCTTPQTCTVCGTILQEATGHTPGPAATCTTPQTCTVCGAVLQEATGHTPGPAATCTTPQTCTVCNTVLQKALGHKPGPAATCTTPQTCTVCGAVLQKALGHKPGPAATCTTPQTCTVCDAVLAKALGHDWKDATCTTPKTCARCNATEGAALGHLLPENWETVSASTDSKHGEAVRRCERKGCDYSETRTLNIIGDPANNTINGLTNGSTYELKTVLTFSASGAGMGNTAPVNGDVRYVPTSWRVQNTPGSFRDNYTGSFSITQAGTYTLTVSYQKQSYNGSWQATDTIDNKSISFTVGSGSAAAAAPSDNAIRINPQTGDDTPIMALVIALVVAAAAIVGVVFFRRKKK